MPNVMNLAIHAEYEKLFAGTLDGLFVQPLGLTVEQVDDFRDRLAKSHLRMQVLKGSLAKRALEARGLSQAAAVFEGPVAFIGAVEGQTVDCAAIAAGKALQAWLKESGKELPVLKGGMLEGQFLDKKAAAGLHAMPTKRDLQARLVGQILGPGRRLAAQFPAAGGRIAGALKTHIGNLEKKAG
jgi:large subunit ribosomal protein L10